MSQHTRTHTKERGRQYGSVLYLPHFVSSFTVNPHSNSICFYRRRRSELFTHSWRVRHLYKIRSRFLGEKCICLSLMHLRGGFLGDISSRLCMKSELTFMLKELLLESITLTDDSPRQSIRRI